MKFFMERKGISICCKGEKESEICGFISGKVTEQPEDSQPAQHPQSLPGGEPHGNHCPCTGSRSHCHKTDTPLAGGWTLVLGLLSLLPLATQWHYHDSCCVDQNLQHDASLSASVQFSSVSQSCPTLCDPTDCNTPGLPVHHQLPEFTQPHVHQVGDAIQPSHPLSSPSPPAFNLS